MSKQFKPSIIATILTLIAFLILLKLGFWQLQRAEEKAAIEQSLIKRPLLPVLNEQELSAFNPENLSFRRVKLTGFFDTSHQFFLDNQHLQHKIGFRVLTPFVMVKNGQRLLIDRGFIPRSSDMKIIPMLKPISGLQTIEGMIEPAIKNNFVLGTIQQTQGWPMVIEAIDFSLIQQQLHQTLMPIVLQLDANSPHSFVQLWRAVQVSHQRHIAYAIQWFLLATALLIIFTIANFKKVNRS